MTVRDRVLNFAKISSYKFFEKHKSIVLKNEKFKNIHRGETCFIIGNGGSLKYYDLSVISKFSSIGCTYSMIDNRIIAAGLNYYVIPDQFCFYPIWYYKNSIQLNLIAPIFKKILIKNQHRDFQIFTSLTHYYAFPFMSKNWNYFYHFGEKNDFSYNLSANFSAVSSSLEIMIGIAEYLGFSKAILLGCDYLGTPCMEGHFYSDSKPFYGDDKVDYMNCIKQITAELKLDILAIFPEGVKSPYFESVSFKEYFGINELYHHNYEIIDDDYIALIRKAAPRNQISI